MKFAFRIAALIIVYALFLPNFGFAAGPSGIVIDEVFFNPVGVDTAKEYIIIKNNGPEAIDITGWDLYPDGIGYFTIPTFILASGKSAVIHLRKDGASDNENLYHASAASNLGNTSGSVALFSSIDRGESTLVDFVEYGKGGKTWESAADKAMIWTKGEYVDITALSEGQAIKRKSGGYGVTFWEIGEASIASEGDSGNIGGGPEGEPEANTPVPTSGGSVSSAPVFVPKIRAYAGEDIRGVAGAGVQFSGIAIGWQDEVIDGDMIRYLWNFGDGALQNGRNVSHIYIYPGIYTATLTIVSGEESASDSAKIEIGKNPVVISEFMPGENGWLELENPSSARVDLSLWALKNEAGGRFIFPKGTFIAERAFAVFPKTVTGIFFEAKSPRSELYYPNGMLADSLSFIGDAIDGSIIRGEPARIDILPTPGTKNNEIREQNASTSKKALSLAGEVDEKKVIPKIIKSEPNTENSLILGASNEIENSAIAEEGIENEEKSLYASALSSNTVWLFTSAGVGIFIGLAALFLKRKLLSSGM